MGLLVSKIDLDLEDMSAVFIDAQETIKYLSDVVSSIKARVEKGEEVSGLKLVKGKKSRRITEEGFKYLEKTLGHDKVYTTTEKPIGITALERLVDAEEMIALHSKGVIAFKFGKDQVVIDK